MEVLFSVSFICRMHQFIFCICGRGESADGSERRGSLFRKVGGMCGQQLNFGEKMTSAEGGTN